jgi:hypothetical protein
MIPLPFTINPLVVARVILVAIVLGAIGFAIALWNHHERELGRQEVRTEWQAEREKQAQADLEQARSNAKETIRRLDAQKEAQDAHDKEKRRYEAAVVAAADAAAGMRDTIDNLEHLARGAARDSAAGQQCQAAGAAGGMLAQLSRGADALAELYAKQADASRRAGEHCALDYDALSTPK